MPNVTVPGFILDKYGRPALYGGHGNQHRRSEEDKRLRPNPPSHFADFLSLFSPHRYRELVSNCRSLSSRGLVSALLEQKADYIAASGYAPIFTGSDAAWGADAVAALTESMKICNVRGPRFDWRTTWRLSFPTRATDGSFFVLLTEWADSGWPAVQILEGHRIGQRDMAENVVGATDAITMIADGDDRPARQIRGAYKGLRIHQGIIYNEAGTEVAYRVLGADKDQDQDISARDLIHVARPRRHSEGRPVPELAAAALDFLALDEAQTAQLDQQIIDAKQTFIETNATGKYDAAAAFSAPGANIEPTQVYERGQTRFVKSGYTLTAAESDRPSDQWMNFDHRVASRAAAAIRWRVEMLDPSALRGAATRAFQDQINTSIADEFQIDAPAIRRTEQYFVAKLIKMGVIDNHPDARMWDVATPPWFEVDRNSARIDLEEVAAGRVSMEALHQRNATRSIDVLRSRANLYKLAKQVHAEDTSVPFEVILGSLGITPTATGEGSAEGGKQMESIAVVKAKVDAYGVGVRAGAITPSEQDEEFVREALGLPLLPPAARKAWKGEPVRRPITITPKDGSSSAPRSAPPTNEDDNADQ